MHQRTSCQYDVEKEKPNNAAAVIATDTVVTRAVPKRWITRSAARLETIVQALISIASVPAPVMVEPISSNMLGQALPSRESGSPREIKAR